MPVSGEEGGVTCVLVRTPEQLRECEEAIHTAVGVMSGSRLNKMYLLLESEETVKK